MDQNNDWLEGIPRWPKEDKVLTFSKVLVISLVDAGHWFENPFGSVGCWRALV